jgi:hypothetical protein
MLVDAGVPAAFADVLVDVDNASIEGPRRHPR